MELNPKITNLQSAYSTMNNNPGERTSQAEYYSFSLF